MQKEHIKVHFSNDWMNILWERKVAFFAVFFFVAMATYGALYAADFYPEYKAPAASVAATTTVVATTPPVVKPIAAPTGAAALPVKITIEALDKTVTISNPESDGIDVLNQALLSGAIHYPGTATFEKPGTMVLLGHSSYLPVVHNKSFQAFNGIQKLVQGDIIRVESPTTEYFYRVETVEQAKASTGEVVLQWEKPELVLVTCNSFGAKEDRFVVRALLVDQKPLEGVPQNG